MSLINVYFGMSSTLFNTFVCEGYIAKSSWTPTVTGGTVGRGYSHILVCTGEEDAARRQAYLHALMELCGNRTYSDTCIVARLTVPEEWVEQDKKGYDVINVAPSLPLECISHVQEICPAPADLDTAGLYLLRAGDDTDPDCPLAILRSRVFTEDFSDSSISDTALEARIEQMIVPEKGKGEINMADLKGHIVLPELRRAHGYQGMDFRTILKFVSCLSSQLTHRVKENEPENSGEVRATAMSYNSNVHLKVKLDAWLNEANPYEIATLLLRGSGSEFTEKVVLPALAEKDWGACCMLLFDKWVRNVSDNFTDAGVRIMFNREEVELYLENEYPDQWKAVQEAMEKIVLENKKGL